MPLFLTTACVEAANDSAFALEALRQAGHRQACWLPGRRPGIDWAARARAFEGGLWLHHACLDAPDDPIWNLACRDRDLRKRSLARATETLRVAAGLGAPAYSLHAGFALDTTIDAHGEPLGAPVTRTAALDRLCLSLDALASVADDLRVGLWLENGYDTRHQRHDPQRLLAAPDEIEGVFRRMQAPLLGLWLDLSHLILDCNARRYDPEEVLPALVPHARALGLSRPEGRVDAHAWPRPDGLETTLARAAGGMRLPIAIEARVAPREGWEEALASLAEALEPHPTTPAP